MEFGISVGSNLGDRLRNLQEARRRVVALAGVRVVASAPVYETEPVEVGPAFADKRFLNSVLVIESAQAPEALAADLRRIEDDLGRVRSADRNAPRTIDLDVLYAGDVAMETAALILPHPRWNERRFVVQPLADVRPDLVLPWQRVPVAAILLALPVKPDVVLFTREW